MANRDRDPKPENASDTAPPVDPRDARIGELERQLDSATTDLREREADLDRAAETIADRDGRLAELEQRLGERRRSPDAIMEALALATIAPQLRHVGRTASAERALVRASDLLGLG